MLFSVWFSVATISNYSTKLTESKNNNNAIQSGFVNVAASQILAIMWVNFERVSHIFPPWQDTNPTFSTADWHVLSS